MLNKRGQFYIVAAIIIVMIIIGLVGVTSYTYISPSPPIIYELDSELNQEGASIIDYGIYTEETKIKEFVEETFAEYFLQKTQGTRIAFVYGDETGVYLTEYNTIDRGKISLSMGEVSSGILIVQGFVNTKSVSGDNVNVNLFDSDYKFNLKPGEKFYFIIGYQEGEEMFIEKNSNQITKIN